MNYPKAITLSVVALAIASSIANAEVKEVRILESGGPSGDSIEQAYIKPFTAKSGVKVVRESPSGIGKLQAMVQADDDVDAPDPTTIDWYHAPATWHLQDLPVSLTQFISTVQGVLFGR